MSRRYIFWKLEISQQMLSKLIPHHTLLPKGGNDNTNFIDFCHDDNEKIEFMAWEMRIRNSVSNHEISSP